jgi:hypothetical protein
LRCSIREIQDLLIKETAQRDQLRTIVGLQRKRISHKSEIYTETVDQFERSVILINESIEGPKKTYYGR